MGPVKLTEVVIDNLAFGYSQPSSMNSKINSSPFTWAKPFRPLQNLLNFTPPLHKKIWFLISIRILTIFHPDHRKSKEIEKVTPLSFGKLTFGKKNQSNQEAPNYGRNKSLINVLIVPRIFIKASKPCVDEWIKPQKS